MNDTENLGSFFRENKRLARNYFEIRLEILRLYFISAFSKSVGYFIWIMISFFLLFLFFMVLGVVAGFWFSKLTGSYITGFGIVAGAILISLLLLYLFRRLIFINPVIRNIIKHTAKEPAEPGNKN